MKNKTAHRKVEKDPFFHPFSTSQRDHNTSFSVLTIGCQKYCEQPVENNAEI
jgi:hypothetical protein